MEINRKAHEIRYFLSSQAFADGLRMTVAILLPALVTSYFGSFPAGLAISLGAFCVSLTDAPGPTLHRRNGMMACALLIYLVATVTALTRTNQWLLGLEIAVFSFLFSMFSVYGNRVTAIGNAGILIMILTMDDPVPRNQILQHSSLILFGGAWYLVISLALNKLQPYRSAQRALGDCIREIALYLSIKADFYNPSTDLQSDYRRLVGQQIVVHEKQDAVRELFFKTRQIVMESTTMARRLVLAFVESVDLFEDITASYYDYAQLRNRFADSGLLEKISTIIKEMASELDRMGIAIQINASYTQSIRLDEKLAQLKSEIDALTKNSSGNLILKKILVNLRRLNNRFNELDDYFEKEVKKRTPGSRPDHARFVSHQPIDPKIYWSNFSWSSAIFKHALRVSMACIAGFLVVKLIGYGTHSYWILLTIAFILKPAFSLTKQRNKERIIGTLAGGAVGVFILYFVQDRTALFIFMVVFMLGNYTFLRINYLAMVMFATPFVLILFSFFGWGFEELAGERLLDTVIGCAIAFGASYFLFPSWEKDTLKEHLTEMLYANAAYLKKINDLIEGKPVSMLEYKLVRKEVYVHSANLSATFQRMLSEPKKEQSNSNALHQFVVLNHILFSNIATVASAVMGKEKRKHSHQLSAIAQRSFKSLQATADKIVSNSPSDHTVGKIIQPVISHDTSESDELLKDQLEFIYRLSQDINKTVDELVTS